MPVCAKPILPLLLVTLFSIQVTGCGATDNNSNTPDQHQVDRRVEEARQFIIARTVEVRQHGSAPGMTTSETWRLLEPSLGPTWTWSERNETTVSVDPANAEAILPIRNNIPTVEIQSYRARAADLSVPATVFRDARRWGVKFECRISQCIEAAIPPRGSYPARTEMRNENVWWYNDQSIAERTAAAITALLRAEGAMERTY